ncbi:restriction endonuclease subunit S [Lactobacillus huangpiensis]|uniref:restriction endonuclease subunit S n=1 Tax=Lactobacillus huangpiensis TaxID=2799571 RepID=UPI001CC3D5AC|nr:restriction endonuclease subunit S [Lactobacillus huangpiensis]
MNEKFEKSNLVGIANFKNGLPMQKFQCEKFENGIPVLKIRELSQGYTDSSSDRCSMKINKDYIVKTGDIVFSWSGTLMVKIWSGTTSGLNQHLFKITSKKFPSWFIYEWTKHYLKKFKLIAAGKATTMGHIKRSDIMDSIVFIPNYKFLSQLTKIMKPIYDERIKIIKQNQHLNCLKKEFLTKYF